MRKSNFPQVQINNNYDDDLSKNHYFDDDLPKNHFFDDDLPKKHYYDDDVQPFKEEVFAFGENK